MKREKSKRVVSERQQELHLQHLKGLCEENEMIVKSGIDINDAFMLAFLKGRKYKVDHAFETIKKYVDVRKTKYVEFFKNLQPNRFLYMYDLPKFQGRLKYRTDDGYVVGVTKPPSDINQLRDFHDVICVWILAMERDLHMEEAVNKGMVLIGSGRDFNMNIARELTPSRLKMVLDICHNAYPFSIKQLHLVECSTLVNWTISVLTPFIPRKMRKRLVIHKNLDSLHQHFPKDVLPNWLGGNHVEENVVFDAMDAIGTALDREEPYDECKDVVL